MTLGLAHLRSRFEASKRRAAAHAEQSAPVRIIALVAAWWADGALGWVGAPLWIWMGGLCLVTVGYIVGWRFRSRPSPTRSLAVAAAMVLALVLMRDSISQIVGGLLLPIAYILAILHGLASFEFRSRGGLYASLAFSGVVFFLASQRAIDVSFGIFLIGFATSLVAFLGMSFMVDQMRDSEVRWFRSRASFAVFWSITAVASLVVAAAVFLVLPVSDGSPGGNTQGTVLPMGADPSIAASQAVGGGAQQGSVLPQGPSDGEADSPGGDSPFPVEQGLGDGGPTRDKLLDGAGAGGGPEDLPEALVRGPATGVATGEAPPGHELVMNVRTPVLSYWRGRVFDTFDGSRWRPDRPAATRVSGEANAFGLLSGRVPGLVGRPWYSQTYYLTEDPYSDVIYAGYTPRRVSAVSTNLGAGVVYRVLSVYADFGVDALSTSQRTANRDVRYYQVPPGSREELREIASRVVAGAGSDFERARRIVTLVHRDRTLDQAVSNQLWLTSSPERFMTESGTGTSMDFATATVLLARSVGVPARLATGYRPGRFDPLSGTYVVTREDRHAWAEIYLGGFGWVPFDAAPGLDELPPASPAFEATGSLFGARYGDGVYDAVRSSPQMLSELVDRAFSENLGAALSVVTAVPMLVTVALLMWRLRLRLPGRRARFAYARVAGEGREEIIAVYGRVERMLNKRGVPRRGPSRTLGEYGSVAGASLASIRSHLEWFRRAVSGALYDPSPVEPGLVRQAHERLGLLKAVLRSSG